MAIPVAAVTGTGAVLSGGTIPHLNHQFVMIQTKKWLYLVSKGRCGCECLRATHDLIDDLIDYQKLYNEATRPMQSNPTPQIWKEDKGII